MLPNSFLKDNAEARVKIKALENKGFFNGGGKEGRTPDLCNAIATLYQLSYTPKGHGVYYTQIYLNCKRKMKKVYFSTSSSVTISYAL